MISPWYFAAAAVMVFLSGFFSASEMAYSSVNRMRIENAAGSGSNRARTALKILDRYDDALSAILTGNNLVNIGASSLASAIAIMIAGEEWTWLATVIVTLLIITFGETMPKIMAKKNSGRYVLSFAYIIRGLMIVLKPFIFVVVGLVHIITKPMKGEKDENEQDAAVEELQSIIETAEQEDVLDEDRSELLQAALDFSEISANEVMTSRVDMTAIDIDDPEEIPEIIAESDYSRIPVYEDSIDNIIGVLHVNHYYKALLSGHDVDVRSLLMEPCYVYKTVKLPVVLNELRRRQTHLAIVTDEYGGTTGVITMEDVLEQIVGEIWDETDEIEPEVVTKAENLYEVDGDMSIGEFIELLGWDEESLNVDSTTVGGWTLETFAGFPEEGDSFNYENLTITVQKMDGLRVEQVLVRVDPQKSEE